MDVRVCELCGKLFAYRLGPILCPDCRQETEKKLLQIRDEVNLESDKTLSQFAESYDLPEDILKSWVYEERLKFPNPEKSEVFCKTCKKPIGFGKYCLDCKNDLLSKLSGKTEENSGRTVKTRRNRRNG